MRIHKRLICGYLLLLLFVMLTGCAVKQEYDNNSVAVGEDTQQESTQQEQQEQREVYLVTVNDQVQEILQLYRYSNGMEYRYYYGTGTRFYDEYGNRTNVSSFMQGMLITIGDVNSEGILCEAQISDQAWVYDGITRFSVDSEMQMLTIADSKYRYDENTFVFSGDETVSMTDIAQGDTLSVVGMDKKILAVRITTAQGTLALTNTELFEGSFVQLGTKIFAEITPDMELQVPEGTYDLIVANNGWGGSEEVTIVRGQTTTVDLNELKGKGPTKGKIQFLIDVEGAVLVIDGQAVDYEEPVKLTYGTHSLVVYATGYDTWKRNLYVNSKESTIVISLTDEEDSETTVDTSTSSDEQTSEQNSSETESQTESEDTEEDLDTILDLISSMTSASSILSN